MYNLKTKCIICFYMEMVKFQGETRVLDFATQVWSWLTASTIFHYTTFLYSTWIHLATLLVWRSKESSQYEENEVLTIEMVEQEAANRNHSFSGYYFIIPIIFVLDGKI